MSLPSTSKPCQSKKIVIFNGENSVESLKESAPKPRAPFQNMLVSKKQSTQKEKILDVFMQVKVNVPILDAIQHVSSYAKFLKDLCTYKRTNEVFFSGNMTVDLNMFNLYKKPIGPSNEPIEVNMIQELLEKYLIYESLEFYPGCFDQCFEDIFGEEIMYKKEVNNLTESTIHNSCSTWEPRSEPLLAEPRSIPKPCIEEAPNLELKPLHVNLNYAYIDSNETLPIIIAANLTTSQEEALLVVLRDNKEIIG